MQEATLEHGADLCGICEMEHTQTHLEEWRHREKAKKKKRTMTSHPVVAVG